MRDVRQASLPAPGRNPEPRRPRWRAIVLLALTSTGCALVSLDLDALRTGVAAPADGGGDAAGTDAQGTGPEDAGADADAAAEPGFCSYQDQAQTFCDDFDRERQLWTRQVETGAGGRLAIDLVEPSSPPSSLLAAQDADDPGGPPFARYREKEFSTRPTGVSLICAMRLDRLEGAGFDAFEVTLGNLAVSLRIEPLRTMLRQRLVGGGTATKETQLRVDPRPGVWESVEVAVSFTGRSLLLSLGGEVTEEAMLAEAANPGTNAPSLRLGIVGTSGPGRIAIGYDDVLFLDK